MPAHFVLFFFERKTIMFKTAFYQAFRSLVNEKPLDYEEMIEKGHSDIFNYRPYVEESKDVQQGLDNALLASFKLFSKNKERIAFEQWAKEKCLNLEVNDSLVYEDHVTGMCYKAFLEGLCSNLSD